MTTVLTSIDTNAIIHTKLFHITFGTFERIDHINFPINTLSRPFFSFLYVVVNHALCTKCKLLKQLSIL